MQKAFKCTDPEYLATDSPLDFLGFRLTMGVVDGVKQYWMDQESEVIQLCTDHDIKVVGEVDCPMPTREALFRDMTPLTGDEVTEFRSIVGGLAWFGVSLRWDITQSVNRLQQFGQAPHRSALSCAMRVCTR